MLFVGFLLKIILKKRKKMLAFPEVILYNSFCCDMIALKREVVTHKSKFSVERMSS